MSDTRRAGDADPNKAIIADAMKLVNIYDIYCLVTWQDEKQFLNITLVALFGFTGRQLKLWQNINKSRPSPGSKVGQGNQGVSQLINTPFFRQIDQIDKDTYEVQSCKKNC